MNLPRVYGEVPPATRSRQLTITSMGDDGLAGSRPSISSRPSAATSNDGGCPARMNDFSNSIIGGSNANRAFVSVPTRTRISLSPSR